LLFAYSQCSYPFFGPKKKENIKKYLKEIQKIIGAKK
jgi:hypothetical protein